MRGPDGAQPLRTGATALQVHESSARLTLGGSYTSTIYPPPPQLELAVLKRGKGGSHANEPLETSGCAAKTIGSQSR